MKRSFFLFAGVLCALCALFALAGCPLEAPGASTESLPEIAVVKTEKNLLEAGISHKEASGAEADLWFPSPADMGATSYTLEYKDGATWKNFQQSGADVVAASDNVGFSITAMTVTTVFRLRIAGGVLDGKFSNSVTLPLCTAMARVNTWSLDESMSNSGVMAPNVGYGLKASCLVHEVPLAEPPVVVADPVTYQWYRVDPNDWTSRTPIVGATGNSYTTTAADKGYSMQVVASGKAGVFDGGEWSRISVYVVGYNKK